MLTPPPSMARGSMVPLRGLQLLCCAAVLGVAVHVTTGFAHRADVIRDAEAAFEVAHSESVFQAALLAASISETTVKVQRNDTLDQIFRRLQLSLQDMASILSLDDARKALTVLRPGEQLTFATRGEQLVGLHRPISVEQMLRVERDSTDNFTASIEEVPLTRHVVSTGGVIDSSLYLAGMGAGLHDATTMELTEIFRWDVDFYQVRPGDSFKVIYEQREHEGERVKDGNILAAEFTSEGKVFRAVRYENPNGKVDYYTPEGVSLKKAYLKAPVKFSRISSVYNPRRRHPVLNTIRAHRGVDYAAPTGTPVLAAGAGRVQFRGVKGGFGNVVEIAHAGKVVTRYGHLSRFAAGVTSGTRVDQGDVIGYVGSTGLATGPHLHFEFMKSGQHVDPQKAISQSEPGPPVPPQERAIFEAQTGELLAQLIAAPAPTSTALAAR